MPQKTSGEGNGGSDALRIRCEAPGAGGAALTIIRQGAVVPYTAEQMYELVNGVESYPEFLPWCTAAEVQERSETELTAVLTFEAAGARQSFTTRNRMQPGRRIDVHLVTGPFKYLDGFWEFIPEGAGNCRLRLEMQFEFRNRLVQVALNKAFSMIVNSLVDAFTRRAEQLYGPR
jgi:ribosome-associated toxin RatA of RatAB toxin-antitoxin module